VEENPDFLKRHPFAAAVILCFLAEVVGHALWLRGVIPDNNFGGEILYGFIPLACVIIMGVFVARKYL